MGEDYYIVINFYCVIDIINYVNVYVVYIIGKRVIIIVRMRNSSQQRGGELSHWSRALDN